MEGLRHRDGSKSGETEGWRQRESGRPTEREL